MRLPELLVSASVLELVARDGHAQFNTLAGKAMEGARVLLREEGGTRCLEVDVDGVRVETGALDLVFVKVAAADIGIRLREAFKRDASSPFAHMLPGDDS